MHPTRNRATLNINGSSGRVMPGVRRLNLSETLQLGEIKAVAAASRLDAFDS